MKTTRRFIILFFAFFGLFASEKTNAQAHIPIKSWDKTFGADNDDEMQAHILTNDGGSLIGGFSWSGANGDKTQPGKGNADFWVTKTDNNGNKQWDKTFGGTNNDLLYALATKTDGSYLLGGQSNSPISGDKSQASRGGKDYWVVKLDAAGNKQWDKTFGGSSDDILNAIVPTTDGGFLLGGYSLSGITSDKSQASKGGYDYWVVKLDANGTKQWDKTFGGANADILTTLTATADGGYLLGGRSSSGISGDKSQVSRGGNDYWLVKLNANGNKVWDKTLGGSSVDYLLSLTATTDGGYLLGGYSLSGKSGDKTQSNYGGWDYWIVKTDSNGNKQWDKTFGGNSDDFLNACIQSEDGGYVLAGYTYSDTSSDKTESTRGFSDFWMIKTDSAGNMEWNKTIGGSDEDILFSLTKATDGGFMIGGFTLSDLSGDKTQETKGGEDYWIIKINVLKPFYLDSDNDGFGNNAVYVMALNAPAGYAPKGNDCNDTKNTIYPGAAEICDNIDNDCDGQIDEGALKAFYLDYDKDGYGNNLTVVMACTAPTGYVTIGNDCQDKNNTIYPGAPELPDNLDNDCDGIADDGLTLTTFYHDYDRDGYGNILAPLQASIAPVGYVSIAGDCNDKKNMINPGVAEVANNGIDDNCNGLVDEVIATVSVQNEVMEETMTAARIQINAAPNPSTGYFTLSIQAKNDQPVHIKVLNMMGSMVEQKLNIASNTTLQIGQNYQSGVYFVEVVQGTEREVLKVIKQK